LKLGNNRNISDYLDDMVRAYTEQIPAILEAVKRDTKLLKKLSNG